MHKRILVGCVVASALVAGGFSAASAAPTQTGGACTPGYDPCVPAGSDADCASGEGDGPVYVDFPVTVTGNDPYDLDSDGNGIGCEDETGSAPTPTPTPAPAPTPAPIVEQQAPASIGGPADLVAAPADPVQVDPDYTG